MLRSHAWVQGNHAKPSGPLGPTLNRLDARAEGKAGLEVVQLVGEGLALHRARRRLRPLPWLLRILSLAAFGFFVCVMMVLVPLGCGNSFENPPPKLALTSEGPHAPNRTIARIRECVEEYGPDMPGVRFTFHAKVNVDENGQAIDVETDVSHADLAGCARAALRAMALPPELLLTWVSDPLARGDGQTKAARGLVGNVLVWGVSIVLAPIVIEAAGITITLMILVAIGEEVIEAIRKYRPPPNLNRCLDAAAGGRYLWEELCRAMPNDKDAQGCWKRTRESEQEKRNWCRNRFGR